jgi:prepilin peptidase CpaA
MNSVFIAEAAMIAIGALLLWTVRTDFREQRIPNATCLSLIITGLVLQVSAAGWQGVLMWFTGMITGLAVFLPLYLLKGMAAGDVKLMAALGAGLGPLSTLYAALFTLIAGGVMGLIVILGSRIKEHSWSQIPYQCKQNFYSAYFYVRTGQRLTSGTESTKQTKIRFPYALAIATGALIMMSQHPIAGFSQLLSLWKNYWISGDTL